MTRSDARPPKSLGEDIDELESLLADQAPAGGEAGSPPSRIPVLDEVVEADDAPVRDADLDAQRLEEFSRRLQARIERELQELSGVIRNVVKRCIAEELRSTELKSLQPDRVVGPGRDLDNTH